MLEAPVPAVFIYVSLPPYEGTVTASLDTGKHDAKIYDSNILRDLKMTLRTAQVSRIKEMTHRLFLKRNRAFTTGVLCLRKIPFI